MHLLFFSKMWSCSLWDWMSQSTTQATLSLLEDLQNDNLTDLFTETVEFDEKLLRRNDSAEALKYWKAWDQ